MNFTHFNDEGRARMVDVTSKDITVRIASAYGKIEMKPQTSDAIKMGRIKKGDVLAVAQIAGIMAAKKTSSIIPMCHPLLITGIDLKFNLLTDAVEVISTVKLQGKTGVEMEALVAVSAACLTIYDMCKAIDRSMTIKNIYLLEKSGGKSGHFKRKTETASENILR